MIETRISVRAIRTLVLLVLVAGFDPTISGWALAAGAIAIGSVVPLPPMVEQQLGRQINSAASFAAMFGFVGYQLLGRDKWLAFLIVALGLGAWLQQSAGRARVPLVFAIFIAALATAAPQQAQMASSLVLSGTHLLVAACIFILGDLVDNYTHQPVAGPRLGPADVPMRQPVVVAPIVVAGVGAVLTLATIGASSLPEFDTQPSGIIEWEAGASGPGRERSHPGLRGELDAGDSAKLDNEIILRVRSDRPMYWRGITYDTYDGRYWRDLSNNGSYSMPGSGVRLDDGPVDPRAEEIVQTFTLEQSGLDVFLGADAISVLYYEDFDGSMSLQDRSIRPAEPLGAGAQWTVKSLVIPVTADELRATDQRGSTPQTILDNYAVEDDLSAATAALAAEITAGAPTLYDKVVALEHWFDANVEYTRDVPDAPTSVDPVDRLLFDLRVGYCEQIATSMVVMLRSLGIPARIAVGYVPGEFDESTGEWISRGRDGHAWTEVYFPGVGWQAFDPTSGVPLAGEQPLRPELAADFPWSIIGYTFAGMALMGAIYVVVKRRLHSAGIDPVRREVDRLGKRLELEWVASQTLRERLADFEQLGVDPQVIQRTRQAIESAGFSPTSAKVDGAVEQAITELEAAVEVQRASLSGR